MSGTAWTAPGEGATGQELGKAVLSCDKWLKTDEDIEVSDAAMRRARSLSNVVVGTLGAVDAPIYQRTNLRLTGSPLTAEDLKRIAECEVAR